MQPRYKRSAHQLMLSAQRCGGGAARLRASCSRYLPMTFPRIQDLRTGPQNLLSSDAPRLSPIMK